MSAQSPKTNNRLVAHFRLAAITVGRANTALGAFYRRLSARIGKAYGLGHPQVKARDMVITVPHPVYASPPLLGQHTEEVLAVLLGYSREKIAALRGQGVLR